MDMRISLLQPEWIKCKRVLDIGCNAGAISIDLAQRFEPYRCTGVDIDKSLVREAKKQVTRAFSTQGPLNTIMGNSNGEPLYEGPPKQGYFPQAFPRMFGNLQTPPSDYLYQMAPAIESTETRVRKGELRRATAMPKEMRLFPRNIRFECAEWVNEDIDDDRAGYDLILAFSISKWIHLNQGDQGIRYLFTKVFEVLRPSGKFVLEAQPWSSYVKARKMTDELKSNYEKLELRPDDFRRILLEEIGFEKCEDLGEVGEGGFKRSLVNSFV